MQCGASQAGRLMDYPSLSFFCFARVFVRLYVVDQNYRSYQGSRTIVRLKYPCAITSSPQFLPPILTKTSHLQTHCIFLYSSHYASKKPHCLSLNDSQRHVANQTI